MENPYVSLVDMREKALQALNEYRTLRYGQAEPLAENEISTINDVSEEDRMRIFSMIPSANRDQASWYNEYFRVYGPLQEIQDLMQESSISKWVQISKWAKENRIKCIAWFTYLNMFNDATNVYDIDLNPTHFTFKASDRINGVKTNTETVLENLTKIYPTRDDLIRGKRRFMNWLESAEGAAMRYETASTTNENGLDKILNSGPKVEDLKGLRETETMLETIINALPTNGLTSRTWGFEVEVPDCKGVQPIPYAGIEKGDDGSLRSYESSDDCECSCDDCTYHDCDCEWCENRNENPDHCGDSDCATAESAEYRSIGGVQRVKHNGLYDLCRKLNEAEAEMNDSAGTHIHVYAADLTTNQIGQVFATYKRLEKIFGAIAGREGTSYATRIPNEYVRYMIRKTNPTIPTDKPRAINATHIFNDRGTLEFRQMDCNLNANRITAWAWLMRGLVETAKRGAKLQNFMKVTTLQDIVEVYAKFNYYIHDEQPGLIVPGTKSDRESVIIAQHIQR